MPTTSRGVAHVKPRWPRTACSCARAVHLCALTCGRSRVAGQRRASSCRGCGRARPHRRRARASEGRRRTLREDGTCRRLPAEARTPTDRDWHTDELPAHAAARLPHPGRTLGRGAGRRCASSAPTSAIDLVAYKRRIGRYLLWRAGPGACAPMRATWRSPPTTSPSVDVPAHARRHRCRRGPTADVHARFRTWKEALRDAGATP